MRPKPARGNRGAQGHSRGPHRIHMSPPDASRHGFSVGYHLFVFGKTGLPQSRQGSPPHPMKDPRPVRPGHLGPRGRGRLGRGWNPTQSEQSERSAPAPALQSANGGVRRGTRWSKQSGVAATAKRRFAVPGQADCDGPRPSRRPRWTG